MKFDHHFISLLNNGNIVTYKNDIYNGYSYKDSNSDNSGASSDNNYNDNEIIMRVMVQIKTRPIKQTNKLRDLLN